MNSRDNRLRQLEQKFAPPRLEAARQALARMIEDMGPVEVGLRGGLRATLINYFGEAWLRSPESLDLLALPEVTAVRRALSPDQAQLVFTGVLGVFAFLCDTPTPPGMEGYA